MTGRTSPPSPRGGSPRPFPVKTFRVSFNGETIRAYCLVIDARDGARRAGDRRGGSLEGPAAVFFQGHAQRPGDAREFTSALAGLGRSGVVVVPVCDTPFGTDPAWRGDDGKTVVLREVARAALAPHGIRVEGWQAFPAPPVFLDGKPVEDGACDIKAGLAAIGWSHGGILARRFAHAYPGCVSALGQVCPAGYERVTPGRLTGRFILEALRISRLAAGSHSAQALRSTLGFVRGLTGDVARSFASAAASRFPARALRAFRDVRDCSLYCDSGNFGLEGLARIAVAFGEDDTCMSARRIAGAGRQEDVTSRVLEDFRQRYFSDAPRGRLGLHILPGTHLGPVTHSGIYARAVLGSLGELARPGGD